MLEGASVFLTGPPGAGKTYVLNEFIRRAQRQNKTVAVTASTGIAATHVGGTTIHSWSGLGIRESLSEWDRERLQSNDRLIKRYNAADVLVIDEVSMLHGVRLDMVNQACKLLRKDERPFGGLQVVLVGDLFQLPPVNRGGEAIDFAHTSEAWRELSPKICYLTEQHRQDESDGLLDLLNAMRQGDVNELHEMMLQERLGLKPEGGIVVTRLYSHNADVESINQKHLDAIDNQTKMFIMQTKGNAIKVEQLVKSVLAPERLELKKGAEVMFVANNYQLGFANGSRGQVVDFRDSMPVVELANGRQIKVEPHTWTMEEDGRKTAEAVQLPLRLAWAITIHKSQGMSLDAAEIDLSRSFTPGMGYVALSRVRSLDGVYLGGINNMALSMHPQIYEFDAQLRESSDELANDIDDMPEAEPDAPVAAGSGGPAGDQVVDYDQELFDKLRAWRGEQARAKSVAPYMVAHDTALKELARVKPVTAQKLMGVKGFGPKKIETYGEDILNVVMAHTGVGAEPGAVAAAWTPVLDSQLINLFNEGTPLDQTAAALGKTPAEAWSRLQQLL